MHCLVERLINWFSPQEQRLLTSVKLGFTQAVHKPSGAVQVEQFAGHALQRPPDIKKPIGHSVQDPSAFNVPTQEHLPDRLVNPLTHSVQKPAD